MSINLQQAHPLLLGDQLSAAVAVANDLAILASGYGWTVTFAQSPPLVGDALGGRSHSRLTATISRKV